MRAYDFIENRLQCLVEHFPQMKVSYEFDGFSNSHFIEVLPSNEFRENLEYSKYETNLIIDFISEFPNEEIVFVTKNDLMTIENPLFIKKGSLYENKPLFWNSITWSNNSILDFNLKFKRFLGNNISSIDLANAGVVSFDSDSIIISPLKEEPVDLIVNSDDFALAA
ncbi:MAG: hypothetical protein RBR35_14275 [Salinivirgaceae bacterium]|nr:hypothetical protein [Salinivirgaceae bacterium]